MKYKLSLLSILMGLLVILPSSGFSQVKGECPWIHDYLTFTPNFPKPGINFLWYANLLKEPKAFREVIQAFANRYKDLDLDAIVGLDSRGFIFGSALAYELEVPFVVIRKSGKLPREVKSINYSLEYGNNSFEIEVDSLHPGSRVVIVDDVLATGGTARAAKELVEQLEGEVIETAFLIELASLNGRDKLETSVYSLIALE